MCGSETTKFTFNEVFEIGETVRLRSDVRPSITHDGMWCLLVPRLATGSHLEGVVDSSRCLDDVLGFPLGAFHAPTQFQREHWPASTVQYFMTNAEANNKRLIWGTWPSSDPVLDEKAWSESTEEITMNIVKQPVCDPNEVPFAQFCLVRRHGLRVQHGESGRCRLLKQVTTHQASTLRIQRCKQVLLGFLHLFRTQMEPGVMYSDAVPPYCPDDSSGTPQANLPINVLSNLVERVLYSTNTYVDGMSLE